MRVCVRLCMCVLICICNTDYVCICMHSYVCLCTSVIQTMYAFVCIHMRVCVYHHSYWFTWIQKVKLHTEDIHPSYCILKSNLPKKWCAHIWLCNIAISPWWYIHQLEQSNHTWCNDQRVLLRVYYTKWICVDYKI